MSRTPINVRSVHSPASPDRRGFLRSCLLGAFGLTAHLCIPFGMVRPAKALTLARSLRPEVMVLMGQVRTCARSSTIPPFYEDGAVLIRNGRIKQVGPRDSIPVPDDAMSLELPGSVIMPGLIDAHVHEVAAVDVRRNLLAQGVTSVGDVGSALEDLAGFTVRRGDDDGPLAGVYGTGPMIGPEGGYPGRVWPEKYGLAVNDARSAGKAAERLLESGATMLKIGFEPGPNGAWPILDYNVARAVASVAHEHGAVVRCHVQDYSGLDMAIKAGVDVVEHTVLHCADGAVFIREKGDLVPGPTYAGALKRLADAGIMLVPTLQMAARAGWDGSGAMAAVRLFREAGGEIGLGTDAPMRGVKQGMFLEEMRLMALAGMDNEAILHAATISAAKAMGQGAHIGSIEPGKAADLIVVADDPAMDIQNLRYLGPVMKDGAILPESYSSS